MHFKFNTLFAVTLTAATAAQADTLTADWLYLSQGASWITRTETLQAESTALSLPVSQLQADQFWWQTDRADAWLSWQQRLPEIPAPGSRVQIAGEAGEWQVESSNGNYLLLQQGEKVRYWPQSQWHLLTWTRESDNGLALTVHQPTAQSGKLFYGWQENSLSAQVRYRLEVDEQRKGQLFQELIVSNLSANDIQAEGFSFAVQSTPIGVMRTMSVMADASEMRPAPEAGQSQGVPTLISDTPITLAANAHLWLPVAVTELDSVKRHYQLHWDTRQQGMQQAQTVLNLSTDDTLPELAGSVKIGVFDRQLAMQESYYRPAGKRSAELNLGASALVTLDAQQVDKTNWKLQLSNRTGEPANIEIRLTHRYDNKVQQLPMTWTVPADSEQTLRLMQNSQGEIEIVE